MATADDGITEQARRSGYRSRSLDAVNFLLADVRGALGPYLNVFLITQQHWSQTEVGWVTTISGLLGLVAQTPAGAAIDATRRKRGVVVSALVVLAIGALVIFAMPTFWPVMIANPHTRPIRAASPAPSRQPPQRARSQDRQRHPAQGTAPRARSAHECPP